MKYLFFFLLSLAHLCSYAQKLPAAGPIHGKSVMQYMIYIDSAGKPTSLDTSRVEVYWNERAVLYVLSYKVTHDYFGIQLLNEKRQHYFIFGKDSLYGIDYDGHRTPDVMRIKKDSVFATEWIRTDFEPQFSSDRTKLVYTKSNVDSGTLHEVYYTTSDVKTWKGATCFADYNKFDPDTGFNPLKGPVKKAGMELRKLRILLETNERLMDLNYVVKDLPAVDPTIKMIFSNYQQGNSIPGSGL